MRYKFAIAGVALLLATAALADATVTISLTGAGATNTSKTLIVSDGDGARAIAWAKSAYPTFTVPPTETNPTICNVPVVPPQCKPTERPTTNKEAVEAAFVGLLTGLRVNIESGDRAKAAKTASDAVAPVTPK